MGHIQPHLYRFMGTWNKIYGSMVSFNGRLFVEQPMWRDHEHWANINRSIARIVDMPSVLPPGVLSEFIDEVAEFTMELHVLWFYACTRETVACEAIERNSYDLASIILDPEEFIDIVSEYEECPAPLVGARSLVDFANATHEHTIKSWLNDVLLPPAIECGDHLDANGMPNEELFSSIGRSTATVMGQRAAVLDLMSVAGIAPSKPQPKDAPKKKRKIRRKGK